ncbi:MAG: glycosyltransferase family 4 protein [Chloroflexi bacterium]|nr:glycosyltransferase family 4 protein [Chloroflexota bacterium]
MNICLVSQFYPPDTGGGGIAAYIYYLAQGLRRRGHTIYVISKSNGHSAPFIEQDGIAVYRLKQPDTPYRLTLLPLVGRQWRGFVFFAYSCKVRRLLQTIARQVHIDIVEYADIAAEGFMHPSQHGIPYVVKLHTPHFVLKRFYSQRQMNFDTRLIEWMEKRFILRANEVISPSHSLADIVAAEYGLPVERIKIVRNPIDTDFFKPSECSDSSARDDEPTILYVGRLEAIKGAHVFAKAIPLIIRAKPETRFVFLGADRKNAFGRSMQMELQEYLRDRGVLSHTEFRGHAAPAVFLQYYRQATICVIPSLFENCPYTLLEAMSCGKPVVASNAHGMAEIVDHGETGLLFEPGNAESLANAVITLLDDPAYRTQLGNRAREKMLKKYALAAVAERTEQVYSRVWRGTQARV